MDSDPAGRSGGVFLFQASVQDGCAYQMAVGKPELHMVFDFSIAMTWILYLALFPIAFVWLRRVWRIIIKRDFSEVALKRGESPPNPAKFAPFEALLNLICGVIIAVVIPSVIIVPLAYGTWSAIAGITIWSKFFLDFALSRHAHLPVRGKEATSSANEAAPK